MKNVKLAVSLMIIVIMVNTSCNQDKQIAERNKASLIKAHDEMLAKGNLAYADEVIGSNYAGQGPEWIKNFVKTRREAFPDFQFKLEPVIAEGNMVAWLRTNTGTHSKDYWGFHPTGKKVTWKEMVITRYGEDGKIEEEWPVGDANEMFSKASGIDGVYEYLPPNKGQGVNRNGKFVYLFGSADGKGPMTSNAGTYELVGDSVKNTINYHSDSKQVGTVFFWKIKSWAGDTATYETMNANGQPTGGGRAIRVSH
jgi:predicted ester cyclase